MSMCAWRLNGLQAVSSEIRVHIDRKITIVYVCVGHSARSSYNVRANRPFKIDPHRSPLHLQFRITERDFVEQIRVQLNQSVSVYFVRSEFPITWVFSRGNGL